MKTIFTILLIISFQSVFAQTRKSILKEIREYKGAIYKNAEYKIENLQLSNLLNKYFEKDGFMQKKDIDNYFLTFYKLVLLACNNQNPKYNESNYGGTISKCKVTLYIYIDVVCTQKGKKIKIYNETVNYDKPFTKNIYQRSILGQYKYDKMKVYKFLYHRIINKPISLPSNLQNKINIYNTKHNNKLIKDKDY